MSNVTIKKGSKGEPVKLLQMYLIQAGYDLSLDGIFGVGTELAVKGFQAKHNLTADGIVGAKTWSALEVAVGGSESLTVKQSISTKGIKFIQSFEGLSLKAYDDGVGVWTIGWGTILKPNNQKVRKGDVITLAQAEEYFMHDLSQFEVAVKEAVKVKLSQNQYDAIVSFTYNVGIGALKSSTALKKLNAGDYNGFAQGILSWNKGRVNGKLVEIKGLTRRRNSEKELFLKGVY